MDALHDEALEEDDTRSLALAKTSNYAPHPRVPFAASAAVAYLRGFCADVPNAQRHIDTIEQALRGGK